MGYLKRVGDRKYRIVYDVPPRGGKARQQKTETLVGVTKPEAEAYLAKRKSETNAGLRIPEEITIATLYERFRESRVVARRSPKTIERYDQLYDSYIGPAFRHLPVQALRQEHLSAAYSRWSKKGVSGRPLGARSLRHIHDLIRAMLHYAVRKELAVRNVATLVSDELPASPQANPIALSEAHLKKLLASAEDPSSWAKVRGTVSAHSWFAQAVRFAAYTGARRGETLAMRWSDVHLEEATAVIARSLTQTKAGLSFKVPKNGKTRTVILPQSLVQSLREHKGNQVRGRKFFGATYEDNDLIFAMPDGKAVVPWTFTKSFSYLVQRAGVPYIRLHDLRDTHASLLAKHGVPIEVVSKRLGHSQVGITFERYVHVYRNRDAEAAAIFDEAVA